MKTFLKLVIFIAASAIFSACQKEFSNPGTDIIFDADVTSFLHAAGVTDKTQMNALNDFVIQLKQDSLWNQFLAIYPMIGGADNTTKWNLKDPRDMDAAYRITWHGTPDFKMTGVTCTTETDWGDTHLADSVLSYSNSAISFYSGTDNKVAGFDIGCSNQILPYNMIAIYEDYSNDVVNTWFNQYNIPQKLVSNTVGLFMSSSKNDRVVRYDNGIPIDIFGAPDAEYTNTVITIGKIADDSHMGLKECQLATIGQGLTDAAALKFYNIAKTFQTAIGR